VKSVNYNGLAVQCARSLATSGGFSFQLANWHVSPRSGFMVSVYGLETICSVGRHMDYTATIANYLQSIADIIPQFPSAYVGGWIHDGKLYLDVSLCVSSLPVALKLAKLWKQIAIFDVEKSVSIELSWFRPDNVSTGLQTWSTGSHYPVGIFRRGDVDCVYLPKSNLGTDYTLYSGNNADSIAQSFFDVVNS